MSKKTVSELLWRHNQDGKLEHSINSKTYTESTQIILLNDNLYSS